MALRVGVDLREVFDEEQRGIFGRIVSNGGAMRQQQLVQCVDYSEAKLCGLLHDLVEAGHLDKIGYGEDARENVLYLPGCEPAFLIGSSTEEANRDGRGDETDE